MSEDLKLGDRVFYRQTCRGGYGFERDVPAIVRYAKGQRARIDVCLLDGTKRAITVLISHLRKRGEG